MKKAVLIVLLALLGSLAAAAEKPAPPLPGEFAGWQKAPGAKVSAEPAEADAANAGVLREYGFRDFESAVYRRPERTLKVKAARFADASGAYGAFTFYKTLNMQTEKIGEQGASANEKVLFYRGNVLVEAELDRVTAMSAAELRELAAALPQGPRDALKLPTLPAYLPQQSYVKHSAKYVMGAAGLQAVGAPLPADVVDFGRGAEVALGRYKSSEGQATLVLIGYPTPQIAAERLRAVEAFARPAEGAEPMLQAKRSGPIVAVVSGDIAAGEARSLLASVNYDADVTWSEKTSLTPRDNIGNLIIGAFMLIGIILLFALVLGTMFGGFRLLMKRLFPDRVFDRPEEVEIIRLNLREPGSK